MRGRFSYSIASLTWLERKAATILYSTLPPASMEDALKDFLAAYEEKPEWIENLIFIIRTYQAMNDKENVKKYCNKLLLLTPTNEDERDRLHEAKKLLAKC
ncbi:unnamed protein product [Strongylus vulgaris]|uniref:ER membrane protein complex subunit 2 n=1 Tax=Strongylus vulgaris TaxID=40348 RepID=A0A3P7J8G8_STRVU|nr:unnamed protein product [Strongylus vulgaris]